MEVADRIDRPLPISRLARSRRDVLARLRSEAQKTGCDWGESDLGRNPIAELVCRAKASGLIFWRPEASHVASSEIVLLSWLALAQRPNFRMPLDDELLRRSVIATSRHLQAEGIFLPFGSFHKRSSNLGAGSDALSRPTDAARIKALRFASGRPAVSSRDLIGLGLSRHLIRSLCANGDLVRVRHALYKVK